MAGSLAFTHATVVTGDVDGNVRIDLRKGVNAIEHGCDLIEQPAVSRFDEIDRQLDSF